MDIKIINETTNETPKYQGEGNSGIDIPSNETKIIEEREIIKTGLKFEIPEGYEGQIRPRSGLALKHGITVLNTPGTIDSSFRGELGIILLNTTKSLYKVHKGDRIAQMVFSKVEKVNLIESDDLSGTNRGEKGFGSTGL